MSKNIKVNKSIRLSKEYGLNPSITTCYFCGKEDGIALLGDAYRDEHGNKAQAPMKIGCLNRVPCPECKELMKAGIMLISVRDGETGQDPYRTGKLCVVKEEAVKRLLTGESLEQALRMRMCFVEDRGWTKLGLPVTEFDNRGKHEQL